MTFDIEKMRKAMVGATEGIWEQSGRNVCAEGRVDPTSNVRGALAIIVQHHENDWIAHHDATLVSLAPAMAAEIERLTTSLVEIAETEFSAVRHFTGPSPEDEVESTVDASLLEAIIDEARETLDGKGKSEMENLRETNMELVAALATAREDALKEAAYVALNACLVPPDGGSPTEAEADLCDEAAKRILALIK